MGRLVLGLDIGITSVGYGVIDIDDNDIVDYGVRLFKEGTAEENTKRREKRGSRRLKSRKRTRREDMIQLLQKYGIVDDLFMIENNPYELRVKGLNSKLSNSELATAILHILKHRGNSLEMVEENEAKNKELGEAKRVLRENDELLKSGLYVCEIQKKRLEENGKLRGNINNFRTQDYVKEVKKILTNQDIDDNVKEKIVEIIQRRRHYSDGPGSFKSQTPYGVVYDEKGNILVSMIDKMRGKCSVYPEEQRAPKMSYTADLFNLLNDLNNISINGEKLTKIQKQTIIDIVNSKGGITPKQLAKFLECDLSAIRGFRVNKKDEPIITEFKGYKLLKKILKESDQESLIEDKDFLDQVSDILTKSKQVDERIKEIKKLNSKITEDSAIALANSRGFSGYHSLSFKAMKDIINEMMVSEMNQMQVLHSSNLVKNQKKNLKGQKKIFADDEAILSPVAKRAQREAMKVVNRLREIYGEFDSIVVEVTRDKNSEERKARIREKQKYFENRNKEIEEEIGKDVHINAKTKMKVKLYKDQDGKCMYTGQQLDLGLILRDPNAYEIDHILPLSVSLDDSFNNKVLVTHTANQEKANLTPIMAFRKHRFSESSLDEFKSRVLGLKASKHITSKKAEYLLYDKDLTSYSDMKEFINRNLVDTSYACRVVMNTLADYFKQNKIDTKVHVVRGRATSQFRDKIGLDKDRDQDYSHHAIDALIVASLKKQPVINKILNTYSLNDVYDDNTGEIRVDEEYFDPKYIAFLSSLKNLEVTKFSHKIDTKPNRQIADETIYSTRMINGEEKVVKKYKDIYDLKFTNIADDILNKEYTNKYLMAMHDPKTFNIIVEYINHWYEEFKSDTSKVVTEMKKGKVKIKCKINPLFDYKEEFGYLKKYAKKGNGPAITQMKYIDGKLGNHISLSKNYELHNKKVVLLQISPYRTDFYINENREYRFVTIRYKDVKYITSKGKYVINDEWYHNEKIKKGISESDRFVASFHRDELIGIVKCAGEKKIYDDPNFMSQKLHNGSIPEILKFTATNNDKTNKIEVKPVYKYESKQLMPTISKKIISIKKYSTDVLGNLYEIKNS